MSASDDAYADRTLIHSSTMAQLPTLKRANTRRVTIPMPEASIEELAEEARRLRESQEQTDPRPPGSTPLYLAVRMRSLTLDVASGRIEVGLRLFGFWKSGLPFPEGTVLRQKHGEISKELDREIPDLQLLGKVIRADDAEADREVKFHHLPDIDTDTMVTVFQYRIIEEIFQLQNFPFDEQMVELQIRLPKANAKDGHFALHVSDELEVEKERIRPKGSAIPRSSFLSRNPNANGHGALELTWNVQNLLMQQWTILTSELVPTHTDRVLLTLRLRRKHEYYLTRMLIPSGICASLSMVAWNVEHHEFGERASILVTLFLALVASTTSYASNLPKLPYLTELDFYLWYCMLFTTVVTVGCVLGTPRPHQEGALAEQLEDEGKPIKGVGDPADATAALIDRILMYSLSTLWICYNIYFFGFNLYRQSIKVDEATFHPTEKSYQVLPGFTRESEAKPPEKGEAKTVAFAAKPGLLKSRSGSRLVKEDEDAGDSFKDKDAGAISALVTA